MNNTYNGGPAFPSHLGAVHGMSLRDYFAAKAMQGMLSNLKEGDNLDALPELCYALADAMLKAREAK